jgi:hypothetical protein
MSAIQSLVQRIEKNIEYKEIMLATFIDIEGAFNNTPYKIITKGLQKVKIDDITIKWIKEMLHNRIVQSELNETKFNFKPMAGCHRVVSYLHFCGQ